MTYSELKASVTGWQANHVAGDLAAMYGRDAMASQFDIDTVKRAQKADDLDLPLHKMTAEQEAV